MEVKKYRRLALKERVIIQTLSEEQIQSLKLNEKNKDN